MPRNRSHLRVERGGGKVLGGSIARAAWLVAASLTLACGSAPGQPGASLSPAVPQSPEAPDATRSLVLSVSGPGILSATDSTGATWTCGSGPAECVRGVNDGVRVQVVARPNPGATLLPWSGDAIGVDARIEAVASRDLRIAASLVAPALGVSVQRAGGGSGRVVSSPAGIDCGAVCSTSFTDRALLTAIPSQGSRFAGWISDGQCWLDGERDVCGIYAGTVTAVFEPASPQLPFRYDIVPLEPLESIPAAGTTTILSVNAAGAAAGRHDVPGGDAPPTYFAVGSGTGTIMDLTPPGRDELVWGVVRRQGSAMAIDERGAIAGYYGVRSWAAFLRDPSGEIFELGALPGASSSWALAMSAGGVAVGASEVARAADAQPWAAPFAGPVDRVILHAVRFDAAGAFDLGALPGGTQSWATGVNDAGAIVGASLTSGGVVHPVLWRDGVIVDLDPGSPAAGSASGVSASGVIAGVRDGRAFRWSSGAFEDLGIQASAVAISRTGTIVASGLLDGRVLPGAYLIDGHAIHDLDELIDRQECRVLSATAISASGAVGAQV